MTKHKKSFFERLTGTVKISDDEVEEEVEEEAEEVEEAKERSLAEDDSDGQLAVDVYQTNNDIIIKTMVAGIRPEDLDISITRDMVTIKGSREDNISIEDDDFFHRELFWGSFSRTILLPQEIEIEEAEAIERHGLLTIKLPKINKDRQTKLRVKAS
ncbi:MAG: Hsp20/alpha crystallin family protein [Patescibacteria group bacterium]|nr:Hsp20/alpha crystallin family protein [Patescibacteria group bacterium]MDE1988225.1 Hsp20/alpha crystallin family protein [Patescibacteria group bacterium]MDE2218560.1 Hsp20/alpha crystallin family protein [Patescibacteria group bacterium]